MAFTTFGPMLIVLRGVKAKNIFKLVQTSIPYIIAPSFVYALITVFLFPVVMLLTLGLGLFVWTPVAYLATYAAFNDIFRQAGPVTTGQLETPVVESP